MGVLPLQFKPGLNTSNLGLDGTEIFDIEGMKDDLAPQSEVTVRATKPDGGVVNFQAIVRLDTAIEVDYYRNGGILHTVLRNLVAG
jgi:aconitate hydratase